LVLRIPLANRCQPQRHSIITPKYAFSLLSLDLDNETILSRLTVVEDYGLKTVQEYMYHIRNNAENSVRNLLREVAKRLNTNILSAVDYLDDGSPARAPPKYVAAEVTDSADGNYRSAFASR
jgi:hypothetical protein